MRCWVLGTQLHCFALRPLAAFPPRVKLPALKYTDEGIFQELQETSNVELTKEEKNRQNFLESL